MPFKLTIRPAIVLAMALAVWSMTAAVTPAYAFGPRGFFFRAAPLPPRPQVTYVEQYHRLNQEYPKYRDGFHSRYYQNIGVPSGDVGLRGNGFIASPW